jgi:hypothetical protein
MKSHLAIEKLRSLGYEVKVSHHRYFPMLADCMTRHEYDALPVEHLVALIDVPVMTWRVMYKNAVSSLLGFTTVNVIGPDGTEWVGKHNFTKRRQFNRKVGVASALTKCLGRQTLAQLVGK